MQCRAVKMHMPIRLHTIKASDARPKLSVLQYVAVSLNWGSTSCALVTGAPICWGLYWGRLCRNLKCCTRTTQARCRRAFDNYSELWCRKQVGMQMHGPLLGGQAECCTGASQWWQGASCPVGFGRRVQRASVFRQFCRYSSGLQCP